MSESAPTVTNNPASTTGSTGGVPDDALVVGVDYGTLSGRAVVVRVSDGSELASATCDYRHAVLDRELPTDWALQVPADYVDVLKAAVPGGDPHGRRRPRPGRRHRHRLHRLHGPTDRGGRHAPV